MSVTPLSPPRCQRRRFPKGAATSILLINSAIILMMLTIVGFIAGKVSQVREEVQTEADAVAVAMNEALKRFGPDEYCTPQIRALLNGVRCPVPERVLKPDGTTAGYRLRYQSREVNVQIPLFAGYIDTENIEVRSESSTTIPQEYVTVEERRPKLVLVLDYSGSMTADYGGGSRESTLKQSVAGLLARNYRVDYGAVLFSSGIIDAVPIARGNEARISGTVMGHSANGMTNYTASLGRAASLFPPANDHTQNTGFFVLFATDGQPTVEGDGRPQAATLWGNDVTIFTLNIGASGQFRALLQDLSGPPQQPHNAAYSLEAGNAAAMLQTFDDIMAAIVCRADLPERVRPEDWRRVHLFVEENGRESRPEFFEYANFPPHGNPPPKAYSYIEADKQFVLNQQACGPILAGTGQMLVRYERPSLAAAR